ncbi:hypothetical protein K438DRAFT_1960237 [Mycena galopus ATCC 62051]|nr:hypothetical protein K438DRAFT_1960237 [Mycena galopus ATCC 62051]
MRFLFVVSPHALLFRSCTDCLSPIPSAPYQTQIKINTPLIPLPMLLPKRFNSNGSHNNSFELAQNGFLQWSAKKRQHIDFARRHARPPAKRLAPQRQRERSPEAEAPRLVV